MQTLTQNEKDFVINFLASTLQDLTANNVESRLAGDGFIRMTDALEVMDNLQMLYVQHKDDEDFMSGTTTATWTFGLEDAETALTGYDTEYRECICEQFSEACEANNFTTLAQKVTGYA